MMKKNVVRILTAMLMLSMVFSSNVFAAEKQVSAWDAFLGLFTNNTTETAATTAEDTQVKGVTYQTHIQNEGWAQGWVSDGAMSGSEGKGLRLEALEVKIEGTELPSGLGITYRTHIENEGWAQGWVADGQLSGSQGKGLRLEGVEIKLTGEEAANYSVVYRTHIQNEGWAQGWVADGAMSGSEGKGLRLEGIEIKILAVKADLTAYNAALAAVNQADYSAASWEAYQMVVAANVMTEANTQTEVDAATAAIVAAQADLVAVLKVVSVSAVNANKLKVTFSTAIDTAAANNFAIAGMTVAAATLQDNKTEVVLEVSGAELGKAYVLTATGLMIDGAVQDAVTANFNMPSAESLYNTEMTFTFSGGNSVLKSDGSDSCLVTFKLTDAEGVLVPDADEVEVAFTTTFGSFAENRVTLQNGVATAMLISESLTSERSALVRATVVEAKQAGLINLTKTGNVTMTPVIDAGPDDKVGATLTDVVAAQADRVVLYFNKDVSVDKYTVTDKTKATFGQPDATKATIQVYEEANNDATPGKEVPVVGYMPVSGNSRALYAIIDTANVLTDNANVLVSFSDKTGTVATNSTKMTKLTDARRPAMLSVSAEGLKTLKITFSEPIKNTVEADSATTLANWVIDGFRLDNAKYGDMTAATAVVGAFLPLDGSDTRSVVTITLGKDAAGKQLYFAPGTHSIQGANIGDWANSTDMGNNVMNTQTLDFDIPKDDAVPTASVLVQSPEQYIVTFDKQVNQTVAEIAAALQLQQYDTTTSKWVNVPAGAGKGNATLQVTNLNPENTTFKVEMTQDWTVFYDTATTNKNFYNNSYRLVIAKDAVTAAANGLANVEIQMPLGGAMTSPDVTSPVISEITQANAAAQVYTVTMSEPIKMPVGGDGLPTLAQGQASIPQPTAEFIKKDNTETIPANTVTAVSNDYDTKIVVTPSKELTAGDWTLVVRSISDDVGNTAASATKDFSVQGTPEDNTFKVAFAVADTNYSDGFTVLQTAHDATTQDAVYIKFNQPVKVTGDQINVLKTANYSLNGSLLPTGTQIIADILHYDDNDAVVDSVTIILPNGTLTDANTTVVTISNFLESKTNNVLANGGQKKLPFNFDALLANGYTAAVEDVNAAFGNKAAYPEADYKLFLAAIAKTNLALSGDSNLVTIQAETAKINAALALLGGVGPVMPTATTEFYASLVPGMKIVLVTLDTTTPENYAVSYDGVALTYDPAFGGFKADISTTVSEALTPVVTEVEAPVMPAATKAFYASLVPGMKIVLVTLDTTTPELYAVTYDGIALTYDAAFGGFKADISTTVSEDLTPVVTLV